MAKAKMYSVIIDRTVTVELKGKPVLIYPAGWRGTVNRATLKVFKDMVAGREVDTGGEEADDDTDAEINAAATPDAGKSAG